MITAIDSSVLLDVVCNDRLYADKSETALRVASAEGSLIICECVIAEIRPAFHPSQFNQFIEDWHLTFVPSSMESAVLAGKNFSKYLKRGGKSVNIVPDFFIGAHAVYHANRLLTRDRGYMRDYFSGLKLMQP